MKTGKLEQMAMEAQGVRLGREVGRWLGHPREKGVISLPGCISPLPSNYLLQTTSRLHNYPQFVSLVSTRKNLLVFDILFCIGDGLTDN